MYFCPGYGQKQFESHNITDIRGLGKDKENKKVQMCHLLWRQDDKKSTNQPCSTMSTPSAAL